jgi:hypothetical protein
MKIPEKLEMPAPTAWPIVMAFGLTLVSAGFVTAASVSYLGLVLAIAGAIGWFRQVLPVESHEWVPVVPEEFVIKTERETVERVPVSVPRASLPLEVYPMSAGVRGGFAGGVAMVGLAAGWGILSGNGIWYPMNLLVAGLLPGIGQTATQIRAFNVQALIIAVPLQLFISLLVGLLYGAMLPIASKRPIVLGGFVAPLLWSLLMYGTLAVINPVMNRQIDWLWFVISQIGFGLVAGLVVARHERVRTPQPAPLAVRLGIEAPGLIEENDGEGKP